MVPTIKGTVVTNVDSDLLDESFWWRVVDRLWGGHAFGRLFEETVVSMV